MATITVKQGGGGDFPTITAALADIGTIPGDGAGHIVEVYNGTYDESINNNLPSGNSWNVPFTLRVAPGNIATIKHSGERNITLYDPVSLAFFSSIEGFIFDGTNLSSHQVALSAADSSPSSVRLYNNEFINTEYLDTIFIGSFAQDIWIIGNRIHGGAFVGDQTFLAGHGVYLTGNYCIIEYNLFYNIGGFGVHQYNNTPGVPAPGNNIIRYNIVHDVGFRRHTIAGILVTSGSGTKCYKNLVYNIFGAQGDGGIGISVSNSNNQVYNNTVVNCSWIGLDAQGSTNAIVKNNIAYGNGQNTDFTGANGNGAPSGLVQSNNLIGVDPIFVNVANKDFHLQVSSPAINYGIVLDLSYVDSAPDAGAYEYGGQDDEEPIIPPSPTNDNNDSGIGVTIPPGGDIPVSPTTPVTPVTRTLTPPSSTASTGGSIDHYVEGLVMEERDTSNQYMYTLTILANTLAVGSKIRLKATVHIAEAIPPECEGCIPTTDPGEQELTLIHTYDYSLGIPQGTLGGNNAGQLNYVASLGEQENLIVTVGRRSGFGTSYDNPNIIGARENNSDWQVIEFTGYTGKRIDPVSLPAEVATGNFTTLDAGIGFSGHSDEFGYLMNYEQLTPIHKFWVAYFSYETGETTLINPYSATFPAFFTPQSWTKYGDEIFGIMLGFGDEEGIIKYPIVPDGVATRYDAGGYKYTDVFATANWVYGLTFDDLFLVQLSKSSLQVITTYDTSGLFGTPVSMHIIDDKAAYVLTTGAMYYILFSEGEFRKISDISVGQPIMHFRNGYFYFHPKNFGFGGGDVEVLKYGLLTCPGTEIAISN